MGIANGQTYATWKILAHNDHYVPCPVCGKRAVIRFINEHNGRVTYKHTRATRVRPGFKTRKTTYCEQTPAIC